MSTIPESAFETRRSNSFEASGSSCSSSARLLAENAPSDSWQDAEESEKSEIQQTAPRQYHERWSSRNPHRVLIFHVGMVLVYTLVFFAALIHMQSSFRGKQAPESFMYSVMDDAVRYEKRTLPNRLNATNMYKGPPTPAVEAAWESLFDHTDIRLSEEDLRRMGRTSVQLSDGSGWYLGTPDTYHQLHCVYFLFRNLHPEYFAPKHTFVSNIDHIDHCVDSIRQFIMCHATTSVQTYSWIPEMRIPFADFEVDNVCVDWAHYDGWSRAHMVDDYAPDALVHPTLGPSYPGGKPAKNHGHHHG